MPASSEDVSQGLDSFADMFGLQVKLDEAPLSNGALDKTLDKKTEQPNSQKDEELINKPTGDAGPVSSQLANGIGSHSPEDREKDPSPSKDDVSKDSIPRGSLSSIKNLYAGRADDQGNYTWSDTLPSTIPKAAENDETARHALVVRQKQSFDSRRRLDVHSIIVQSPHLKLALSKILARYPGVNCKLTRLVFAAPFQPFVHRWGDILKLRKTLAEDNTPRSGEDGELSKGANIRTKVREHLELLYEVLQRELKDTIQAFTDFNEHGIVTYKYLWTIFQPGAIVVTNHSGILSAYEFTSGDYSRDNCGNMYQLCLDSIAWDGQQFGRHTSYVGLYEFKGTKQVKSLHALPLALHPDRDNLKARFIRRGKKAEKLAGYQYEAYDGPAIAWDNNNRPFRVPTTGRIVIDAQSFTNFNTSSDFWVNNLKESDEVSVLDDADSKKEAPSDSDDLIASATKPRVRLSEPLHLISYPLVHGYSLKAKKWLGFFVDLVTPIKWNENAFSSLVLPSDQKDLIMSFAETQSKGKPQFDDVISGKGRGIIMLLSGPPGVGKTLTAESVAEQMRVPLYALSAGDLGLHPSEIERELSRVVDMVTKWGAVLLLDECDIFLEARSAHDLERNKVVSLFLKTLEYFEGIFVLTTNRIDNLDSAFKSRIHVSMAYPPLDASSRRKIWGNFLEGRRALRHELSEEDLEELSKEELNGREIKNVLKTAQLLVQKKGGFLRREIIETVLAIERGGPRIGA